MNHVEVEKELSLMFGKGNEGLALVPFDDLLAEVIRRCYAGVIALREKYVDEDGQENPDKCRRYIRSWGDWDIIRGLSEQSHEWVMEEHYAAFNQCDHQDEDGESDE